MLATEYMLLESSDSSKSNTESLSTDAESLASSREVNLDSAIVGDKKQNILFSEDIGE